MEKQELVEEIKLYMEGIEIGVEMLKHGKGSIGLVSNIEKRIEHINKILEKNS